MKNKKILFAILTAVCLLYSNPLQARDVIPDHLSSLLEYKQFNTVTLGDVTVLYQSDNAQARNLVKTTQDFLPRVMALTEFESIDKCQNLELKVIIMSESVLNNRSVTHFLTWRSLSKNGVYGAYDSFHDQETGEIYISSLSSESFFTKILAHEFWHFVQDSTCIPKKEEGAESFANRYCTITGDC